MLSERKKIIRTLLNYKKTIEVNPKTYDELADVYYFKDGLQNAIINYKKQLNCTY